MLNAVTRVSLGNPGTSAGRMCRLSDSSDYPREQRSKGYVTIPPDLAVEVVSLNDLVGEIDEKVDEYLRAGVQLVWVVRPAARAVRVFRSDRSVSWLRAVDELSGEDVLPGFRSKVDDLFPKPPPAEAHGPTTSDAVSPSPAS